MRRNKIYDIFISHSWSITDDYSYLVRLLEAAPDFRFRNFSVPRCFPGLDPRGSTTEGPTFREIAHQIRPARSVLIISAMYVADPKWITAEIELAQTFETPIIGLELRDGQPVPALVEDAAEQIVPWDTTAIVDAIRRHSL